MYTGSTVNCAVNSKNCVKKRACMQVALWTVL